MRARLWAFVAIVSVLAIDQTVKRVLLSGVLQLNGTVLVPGVANIRFTWNRGVSFSLLWPNSDLGSLLLAAGTICIVAALFAWAFRTRRVRVAVAIGLIIGGALGNLIDRYVYGAVFDFLVMRLGEIMLFVCNLADMAISFSTFGLLIDSLVARPSRPTIG